MLVKLQVHAQSIQPMAVPTTFTKLTVKMKNSSTNTAPNGRIPAIRDLQKRDALS